MTKWRTQKLALISALWILCAFMLPIFAASDVALCSSPAAFLQCEQAVFSPNIPHDGTTCCKNARDDKTCCNSRQNSAPRNIVTVAATQHRVLDVALDSFVASKPRVAFDSQFHSSLIYSRGARETRFVSVEHPPPSGRAPPVVWS